MQSEYEELLQREYEYEKLLQREYEKLLQREYEYEKFLQHEYKNSKNFLGKIQILFQVFFIFMLQKFFIFIITLQ